MEMGCDIVTRKDRAKVFVRDFDEHMRRTPYWEGGWPHLGKPPAKETSELLNALGDTPDPDAVDAIMGCPDNTRGTCDSCGESADITADFDVNCGKFTVSICENCCRRLTMKLTMMRGRGNGGRSGGCGVPLAYAAWTTDDGRVEYAPERRGVTPKTDPRGFNAPDRRRYGD
jgi:hypothetical protein